ncbi:hypothetical protein [Psychrobacillus antarcticus]|uniref:hypothetical protein n=1 Tax=Psychrobacillus antarcticus TaxID=2879115 RepID=UPI00240836E8|nr:hypothetical protein [Psychrobacillus antarcticus]
MEKEEGKVTEQDIIDMLTKMNNKLEGFMVNTGNLHDNMIEDFDKMDKDFDRLDKRFDSLDG